MNKQDWLKEAVNYIDSLNTEEFESFLSSCVSCVEVETDFTEIQIGKTLYISTAANMDAYYSDSVSLAA